MNYQVIIVGGGYFGCSIGYHLAKCGVRTLLLDKNTIGSGASGANFGNVQVQDCNMGLSLDLTLAGFELMKNMEEELQCDIGFRLKPSLIGAEKEAHLPGLRKLYDEKRKAGLDIRWIEGKQLIDVEPNLAPGAVLAATYYMQGAVNPFHYLFALVKRGQEHGLHVRENLEVAHLLVEGGVCRGVVLKNDETLRADQVVLAAGAGTHQLAKSVGLNVPVQSVKSEAFVTEALKPFMRTYYSSAAFFAEAHSQDTAVTSLCIGQSQHGNILVAETTKPHTMIAPGLQDATSKEHLFNLQHKILAFFPALKHIQILRSWVTASPYIDTHNPVLGLSTVPGLILASGFKSAVILSAIVGEIVADCVCSGHCPYDLSSFIAQATPS